MILQSRPRSRFRPYCKNIHSTLLWHCWGRHTPALASSPCISPSPCLVSLICLRGLWPKVPCSDPGCVSPTPTLSFIQGVMIVHLGYMIYHATWRMAIKHPRAIWSHDIRPQSGHAGWTVGELSISAVGVVGRFGSFLLPTDEADQSTTKQEQHRGGPAYVDGGAHLSLQGRSHQGVIVEWDGCCCWPADWYQTQDAS